MGSAENVEALRAVYERWGEGDFEALELFDPLVVFVMRPEFPDSGAYYGVERVADYMRGFLEPWDRLTITGEAFIPGGDSVAVEVTQRGMGGGSGVQAELHYFHVWSFRGGRAIRFETVRERAEALELVGAGNG